MQLFMIVESAPVFLLRKNLRNICQRVQGRIFFVVPRENVLAREEEDTRELLQLRKAGKSGARSVESGKKATKGGAGAKIAASTPESDALLAKAQERVRADGLAAEPAEDLLDLIEQMNEQMRLAAENLQFELAARLRDELSELKKELRQMQQAGHA